MQDENVKVTAAVVNHRPVVPAFGYRFDARESIHRHIGDTARSDSLVKLARGADVLVHNAVYLPAVIVWSRAFPMPRRSSKASSQAKHRWRTQGGYSQAAGVKTLVLSHLVPADESGRHRSDVARRRAREFRRVGHRRQGSHGDLRNLRQPIIGTKPR